MAQRKLCNEKKSFFHHHSEEDEMHGHEMSREFKLSFAFLLSY